MGWEYVNCFACLEYTLHVHTQYTEVCMHTKNCQFIDTSHSCILQVISESVHCSVVSDSLRPCGLSPTRLLCPWNSPGKNTRVGSCSLLQGIFETQGLNPGLLHYRWILYCLSHQGSILEVLGCNAHKGDQIPNITRMQTFNLEKGVGGGAETLQVCAKSHCTQTFKGPLSFPPHPPPTRHAEVHIQGGQPCPSSTMEERNHPRCTSGLLAQMGTYTHSLCLH